MKEHDINIIENSGFSKSNLYDKIFAILDGI